MIYSYMLIIFSEGVKKGPPYGPLSMFLGIPGALQGFTGFKSPRKFSKGPKIQIVL